MADADINIVINAKVDGLQQGLQQAEQKVEETAKKMTTGGFKDIGGQLANKLVTGLMKGLAVAAITQLVGGSLNTALEGIQTGKSVGKIANNIASGLVKMGESLPVAGVFVTFFDGLINGSTRAAAALQKNIIDQLAKTTAALDAFFNASSKYGDDTADMKARRLADGDQTALAKIDLAKTKKQDIKEAEDLKDKQRKLYQEQAAQVRTRLKLDPEEALPEAAANQLNKQRDKAFEKIDADLAERLSERDKGFVYEQNKIQSVKDQTDKAVIPSGSNEGQNIETAVMQERGSAASVEFSSSEATRQLAILVSTALQQLGTLQKISMSIDEKGGVLQ